MYARNITRDLKNFILLLVILTILGCANRHVFTDVPKSVKTDFKNAGEQEDYWAEELFDRDYKVEHYKKYKKPIILNGNYYQYKGVVIAVGPIPELRAIFDKGLFYPGVMTKSFIYQPKMKITINKDSLIAWRKRDTSKFVYVVPKTDSLSIAVFNELKFLEITPKQKMFRFWLFRKGFANPTVYFMELTNKKATVETDPLSFINGAKLTFFQEGWIII